ncbi:MAG: type III-A CRISPR-associated RAMP protein Csm4 [Thermodesulfovibrionales bacterium]
MKVYEITIKPVTSFGTPLKGDTIFGHFCWQIAYDPDLIGKTLKNLLVEYHEKPFAIFSSMYPKFMDGNKYLYALKTPNLPIEEIFELPDDKKEKIKKRKEYKAKSWMLIKEGQRFKSFKEIEFLNDNELFKKANFTLTKEMKKLMRKTDSKKFIAFFTQYHNKINRLTNTTGEEGFAPYAVEQQVFYPETELALFVGIDEEILKIEQIRKGLERIGASGFGKDASIGLGRFELGEDDEIDLSQMGSDLPNACYTLSPCVPEKGIFSVMYFTPFTRFGKHGDVLAKSSNPFKNPVIMADEGAILRPKEKDVFNKPYIGRAVSNISKAEPKAVMQGYSLYIPVTLVPEGINRGVEG